MSRGSCGCSADVSLPAAPNKSLFVPSSSSLAIRPSARPVRNLLAGPHPTGTTTNNLGSHHNHLARSTFTPHNSPDTGPRTTPCEQTFLSPNAGHTPSVNHAFQRQTGLHHNRTYDARLPASSTHRQINTPGNARPSPHDTPRTPTALPANAHNRPAWPGLMDSLTHYLTAPAPEACPSSSCPSTSEPPRSSPSGAASGTSPSSSSRARRSGTASPAPGRFPPPSAAACRT